MQGIFRDLLRYKVQEQFKKGEVYHHEGQFFKAFLLKGNALKKCNA